MAAAVGVVDGETDDDGNPTPAPPELRLAWQCERFGCLPDAGGMLDQDYGLILTMTALSNIYNAYSHYRNSQGAAIHSLSESERRILRILRDMEILFRA